jgi:hypothetical protein
MTLANVYMVKPGFNAADNTLVVIDPEPRNPSDLAYADFTIGSDGTAQPVGEVSVDLVWDEAVTYAEFSALLTLFGLSLSVWSAEVTAYLRKDDNTFAKYNCTASHRTGKERGDAGGWWRNFTIHLGGIEAI